MVFLLLLLLLLLPGRRKGKDAIIVCVYVSRRGERVGREGAGEEEGGRPGRREKWRARKGTVCETFCGSS